jgi:hypothetical protein
MYTASTGVLMGQQADVKTAVKMNGRQSFIWAIGKPFDSVLATCIFVSRPFLIPV